MTQEEFQQALSRHADDIARIQHTAASLHENVNQHYDTVHPYSYHLNMVADAVKRFGHSVCASENDVLPLMFGAYFHDSIEDARQTYNDIVRIAREFMDEQQSFMAAEIVYALTNDKGRTRAERAGEKYYAGIRSTPYAPLVKLCDRFANSTYSMHHSNSSNTHMREVYRKEMPHFIEAITAPSDDQRLALPQELVDEISRGGMKNDE